MKAKTKPKTVESAATDMIQRVAIAQRMHERLHGQSPDAVFLGPKELAVLSLWVRRMREQFPAAPVSDDLLGMRVCPMAADGVWTRSHD